MDLHEAKITGMVMIPAENHDAAVTIAAEIQEHMRVDLDKTIKADNCAALSARIAVGRPKSNSLCTATLERMTVQQTIPAD